jgi:hypothetical protein
VRLIYVVLLLPPLATGARADTPPCATAAYHHRRHGQSLDFTLNGASVSPEALDAVPEAKRLRRKRDREDVAGIVLIALAFGAGVAGAGVTSFMGDLRGLGGGIGAGLGLGAIGIGLLVRSEHDSMRIAPAYSRAAADAGRCPF